MADLAHRGRSVVPVPRGRLGRQRRALARCCVRISRLGRCDAVVRRGDRRLPLQRRDRRRQGHGVGLCRRERAVGRVGDIGLGGAGAARPRTGHPEHTRDSTARSRTGERSPFSPARSGTRKKGPPGAQASITALRIQSERRPRRPSGRKRDRDRQRTGDVRRRSSSAPSRPTSAGGPIARPTTSGGRPSRPSAPEPDVGGEVPGGPVRVAPEVSGAALVGRLRLPRSTARRRSATASERRERTCPEAGTTARTSSRPPGRRLLAVADGTLHTIGFNRIGGYRALAAGHVGQRVLLRTPLRVLTARGRGEVGEGR